MTFLFFYLPLDFVPEFFFHAAYHLLSHRVIGAEVSL